MTRGSVHQIALAVLVLQGLVDLPTRLHITSSISAGGLLSALTLWLAVIAILTARRVMVSAVQIAGVFLPFLLLSMAGLLTAPRVSIFAAQNVVAFALLGVSPLLFCSVRMWYIGSRINRLRALFLILGAVPASLFLISSLALHYSLFAPRSLASFLLPVSIAIFYFLLSTRSLINLSIFILCISAIYFTYSRTAFVMLCLAAAYLWTFNTQDRILLRGLLSLVVLAGFIFALVVSDAYIVTRFTTGDIHSFGPLRINMMGRWDLWTATAAGVAESPVFGHGAGQVASYLQELGFSDMHPHNDFLRILFDYGAVGLTAFVGWWVYFARTVLVRTRLCGRESRIISRVCATAILLAFGGLMLTDNVVVYSYAVVPVMAVLTLSLPSRRKHYSPSGATGEEDCAVLPEGDEPREVQPVCSQKGIQNVGGRALRPRELP